MLPSRTLRAALSVALIVVCLGVAGCSATKRTAAQLHGVWYESLTGEQYDFISDTQLVLPEALSNGSNAVTYSIVDGNKISMSQSGVIHVLNITKLTNAELDTQDAGSTITNHYFRKLDDTSWALTRKKVETGALPALQRFLSIAVKPAIVWVSPEPTSAADVWTTWPTSSIQKYGKAWDWNNFTPNPNSSLVTSGSAGTEGLAIDFKRSVITTAQAVSFEASSGTPVITGAPYISVGYSDSMTQYPAGTFVYVNQQLLFSLGDGFAFRVHAGSTSVWGFSPSTHN